MSVPVITSVHSFSSQRPTGSFENNEDYQIINSQGKNNTNQL